MKGSQMKLIAAAALAVLMSFSAASAQQNCGPTTGLFDNLRDNYQEYRVFSGLAASDHIVSIWFNPETGTWSAVMSSPNGVSCLVGSGESGGVPSPKSVANGEKS